jgi:hypothetical protein
LGSAGGDLDLCLHHSHLARRVGGCAFIAVISVFSEGKSDTTGYFTLLAVPAGEPGSMRTNAPN